ncbi:hypothetical protein CRG98_018068 [Punica granatum]|uniref:Protein kinase domain-containing protein n=1 Tax=Punica granatum TaxID=22663 RepID=A0A2I0JZ90_PUNGR|nr:hypothetical protein CRG98_018068 [Punica granatum]
MGSVKGVVSLRPLVALFFILTAPFCAGLTNLRDVTALNNLFVSLGYPPLRGWLLVGGDPCGDLWQGVECVFSNITALNLTNANLGGELGTTWDFPSIVSIDLSNNHIGGSIPSSLPHSLTQLSLGNNSITGVIPDAFQPLSTLIDLNIEKNLFSGPIPEKLLTVPNFKKDGNPFNTSVLPSPPAPSPVVADGPSPSRAAPPSPAAFPWKQAGGPFPGTPDSPSSGGSMSSKMVLVIAGLGALALILIGGLCLGMRRCTKEDKASKSSKRHDGSPIYSESLPRPNNHVEKAGPRELIGVTRSRDRIDHQRSASDHKPDRLKLDKNRMGLGSTANPPRPCRLGLPAEKVTTIPLASGGSTSRTHPAERVDPANTVARYDIASLQLVTNSFSQVNFIGEGTLGSVYRGELPNGKLSGDIWYLHETCQPPIVHRNFKSANVLLNDELEVQVSDCGLAPLFISSSQSSDLFLAANGYAAPEVESGAYTWQSDVYSFGVVMLELLTGRRPYERARPRGTQYLARWAISCLHDIDALSKMVDPLLNGFYPIKSLSRFADIISRCIQGEPEFRPLMSEVVQDLMQVV